MLIWDDFCHASSEGTKHKVTGMREAVSIVTPAYRAADTIVRAAQSVIAQGHGAWEWLIVADDEDDYEAILGRAGIADPRIRFLSTGATGSGSPPARNIGLDAAQHRYAAILDADDMLLPQKLEAVLPHLAGYGMVSCALEVVSGHLDPLRRVAAGDDRVLDPGTYKFVNISMDSMLVHDRNRADPRFNPAFPCLTDIEFALRLFAHIPACFHLGTPLHTYVKQPQSVSNKPGASARIVETKKHLLSLLHAGAYPLADPRALEGLIAFYERSLAAEQSYGPLLERNPGLLFEDHLEPYLSAASTSVL